VFHPAQQLSPVTAETEQDRSTDSKNTPRIWKKAGASHHQQSNHHQRVSLCRERGPAATGWLELASQPVQQQAAGIKSPASTTDAQR
jgi:hypothetical protein